MSKKKETLKIILQMSTARRCCYLIFLLLSIGSLSAQGTQGLGFSLLGNGTAYEVSIGSAMGTHIEIPEQYNGLPVMRIAEYGFTGLNNMLSIDIPNSVVDIGLRAFMLCPNLTSIVIPNSVTIIESSAFYGSGLTSITISNSVTNIESFTFSECISLSLINIPDSVLNIGIAAFRGCTSLTSVYIPNSVTNIGNNAFSGCSNLTIYAEVESQPPGWNPNWNPDDRPVIWGYVSIKEEVPEMITTELIGNYPNPFNPETNIQFSLSSESNLRIDIYNPKGQKVKSILDGNYKAGEHNVIWNGRDDNGMSVSSGIYFYRMVTDDYVSVKKMMLLK